MINTLRKFYNLKWEWRQIISNIIIFIYINNVIIFNNCFNILFVLILMLNNSNKAHKSNKSKTTDINLNINEYKSKIRKLLNKNNN